MDWTPIEQAAITAAAAILAASGAVVAAYIRSHVKDQAAAAALTRAEQIGAGIAHDALTTAVANGAPDWAAAKRVAIQEGTAVAQQELASVTPVGIAAGLAGLLAMDPSAPAGPASSATATASLGGSAAAIAEPAGAGIPVSAVGDAPPIA